MNNIAKSLPQHSRSIAYFQYKMGLQTENTELDIEFVKKGVDFFLKEKKYGFFLVSLNPQDQKPIGSLLLAFENEKEWWICSVYVVEQHRRKGIFSRIFNKAVEIAKKEGVKSIKLYVNIENLRAIKTYETLGMFRNQEKFFAYEFVFGEKQAKAKFEQKISKISNQYKIEGKMDEQILKKSFQQLTPILQRKPQFANKYLVFLKEEKIEGYCQYYYEFSQWRFGVIIYIKILLARQGNASSIVDSLLKYLYEGCQLNIGAIKFIMMNEEDNKITKICPQAKIDHFHVMEIDL